MYIKKKDTIKNCIFMVNITIESYNTEDHSTNIK